MSEISEEEVERVRRHLRSTLQEDISAWLRSRFWIMAVVVSALSFFGVRGVVQQVFEQDLKDARKATQEIIIKAETAIALATDATAKATDAAIQAQSDIAEIRQDIGAIQENLATSSLTLKEIEDRAETVGVSFQEIQLLIAEVDAGATTLTEGSVEALLNRFKSLENIVADIADSVNYATVEGESIISFQERLERLDSESEIRLDDIKAKSEYSVWMWISEVDESLQLDIINVIKSLDFPIATSEIGSELYSFEYLSWDREVDLETIQDGTIILKISDNPKEKTLEFTDDISSALSSALNTPTLIIKDSFTSDDGVIITVKSST